MIEQLTDSVIVDVRVIPRARRSEVAGTRGGALLVRLKAPPVDGAANVELIELLATVLQVGKRSISILSGETSRQKRVQVRGMNAATAARRLGRR